LEPRNGYCDPPSFLARIGAGPVWLGAIEGIADGLSSFAKLASAIPPIA